jgi:hypothetical protein
MVRVGRRGGGYGGGGGCGWSCTEAQASAVEDQGFHFAFGALGWELLTVQGEGYAGGVSGSDYDFPRGADRGVGGGDESFVDYGLAVRRHGDPGSF